MFGKWWTLSLHWNDKEYRKGYACKLSDAQRNAKGSEGEKFTRRKNTEGVSVHGMKM